MQIEILDRDVHLYIELLTNKKKEMVADISAMQRTLEDIDRNIQRLIQNSREDSEYKSGWPDERDSSPPNSQITEMPPDYREKWIWEDKVKYVLEKAKRDLTTGEIVDRILEIEPRHKTDRNRVVRSISSVLSKGFNETKVFGRSTGDSKDFEYFVNTDEAREELLRKEREYQASIDESIKAEIEKKPVLDF